ncbi:MAG: hypothetical protein IJQ86_07340 [Spirochaetia bacterium]|nr:hypothetical protein [Spirochaetia bacterium]
MKKVLTITALLMAVMLVCSCGGSGGSAEDNAPVRVSFAVETPHESLAKIASVDTPNTTFTYWYKAVPQWTGADFTAIQGSTDDEFVEITNYAAGKDIGLFAQGSWKFYAQVKANGVVLYESSATPAVTYINSSSTRVVLDVTRTAGQGTANVTIAIEAPDTGASPNLTASYSGQASGNVTISKVAATEHTGGGWSRYTGTAEGLASGSYLFTLTTTDGTNTVGGAVLAFDIIPGVNRAITGTIENGVFQTALITINVPTFTMSVTAANGATSVAKNTALVYTCTASATNITGNIAYQWYVNNTPVASNGTSSTYSFSQATPGYYYVTCKAYIDGKVAGSQSLKVTVTNN